MAEQNQGPNKDDIDLIEQLRYLYSNARNIVNNPGMSATIGNDGSIATKYKAPQQQMAQSLGALGQADETPSLAGIFDPNVMNQILAGQQEQQKFAADVPSKIAQMGYQGALTRQADRGPQEQFQRMTMQMLSKVMSDEAMMDRVMKQIKGREDVAEVRAKAPPSMVKEWQEAVGGGYEGPLEDYAAMKRIRTISDPTLTEQRRQKIATEKSRIQMALEQGTSESVALISQGNSELPNNSPYVWLVEKRLIGGEIPRKFRLPSGVTKGDVEKAARERGVPLEEFMSVIQDTLERY